MRAYRLSVNLKLGLIVCAVAIAVASLVYTERLVERLRAREQLFIQLWADAQTQLAESQEAAVNPYQDELAALEAYVEQAAPLPEASLPDSVRQAYLDALGWARRMPPAGRVNEVVDRVLIAGSFGIPAIVTDSATQAPVIWRGVAVPGSLVGMPPEEAARAQRRLRELAAEMDAAYEPVPIELNFAGTRIKQYVHYDESALIKELRLFPYVQLVVVALFILIGYVGFEYVRRSEQSSLWVGMAREAAHQLGTPISSLMGWTQLLRTGALPEEQEEEALDEIDEDIRRLQLVANRFSDIGSMPRLEVQPLAPLIESTVDYMRRRMPRQGQHVQLDVVLHGDLRAPVNPELFEWVIENLLKNALDALDAPEGIITIEGRRKGDAVCIEVRDTGRGIDRRQRKNIFRPGYSTKPRGWGLGLSLARRIVEDYHGGALTLERSRPGEGSTFEIELPVAED